MIAAERFSARFIKTQAAVVSEPGGAFVLRDVNLSGPQADEVIVQLEAKWDVPRGLGCPCWHIALSVACGAGP